MASNELIGKTLTVKELFTLGNYSLEFYQREYAWSESNVAELLNDLVSRFLGEYNVEDESDDVDGYKGYFLGPIVVNRTNGSLSLVDGQQRLTTLMLLLVHLNHLSEDEEGADPLESLIFNKGATGKPLLLMLMNAMT